MLTGVLPPDSGVVRLGANVQMVTLEQGRDSLDPKATLAETLTGGRGETITVAGQPKHVMSYMKDFLFQPEQARTPVGVLSGGERGRLTLAVALSKPSNLLVLDEPTNDLDLETLDLLQEMIGDYPGTVIVVSHDRDFLDRVASSVVVSEGNGLWQEYAGGYSDMVVQRGQGVAAKVDPRAGVRGPDAGRTRDRASPAAAPAAKRKLGFKEKHALESLPRQMEQIQAEMARLQQRMDDPTLYQRDPAAFGKLTDALGAAQAKLHQAEEEWLRLEMLREELEG
jgi:ABC transport system ATP-binding/permease protein